MLKYLKLKKSVDIRTTTEIIYNVTKEKKINHTSIKIKQIN